MSDSTESPVHPYEGNERGIIAAIARGAPLTETLTGIVGLIEDQTRGMLCSIMLLDDDGLVLRPGAAPNLPPEYVAVLDGAAIGPRAGSCGAAASLGRRVIVDDIETHPYWEHYRHLALPHGLRACWSSPITTPAGEVLGTFAMYYREPRGPSADDLTQVKMATDLAAVALMCERAQRVPRRSSAADG